MLALIVYCCTYKCAACLGALTRACT